MTFYVISIFDIVIFAHLYHAHRLICKVEYYNYITWLVTFSIYFFIVLLYYGLVYKFSFSFSH